MSVIDLSFSSLSRDAIRIAWPSMVAVTGVYGLWARSQRFVRPSRAVLTVSWLAAAGSAAALVALNSATMASFDGEDWASAHNWYMVVEMPLPASMTFAGLQLIAFLRPNGWLTVAVVGVSALAASLVAAIWFLTAPLFISPVDRFPPWVLIQVSVLVSTVIGYALALPLWLTALRRQRRDTLGSDPD